MIYIELVSDMMDLGIITKVQACTLIARHRQRLRVVKHVSDSNEEYRETETFMREIYRQASLEEKDEIEGMRLPELV